MKKKKKSRERERHAGHGAMLGCNEGPIEEKKKKGGNTDLLTLKMYVNTYGRKWKRSRAHLLVYISNLVLSGKRGHYGKKGMESLRADDKVNKNNNEVRDEGCHFEVISNKRNTPFRIRFK